MTEYLRRLGLFDASMVVMGGIIGGGIFLNPSIVAQRIATPRGVLLTWIIGGAIGLAGALCFAELGSRRPQAGGGYVYLREAFGPLPAFLYGWTFLFIINAGGIAAIAVTFARYAGDLAGLSPGWVSPVAVGAIVVLTGVNYLGVQVGAAVQNLFTVLKLAALGLLIVAGLLAAPEVHAPVESSASTFSARTLGIALIPVLFSYGGWAHANNLGGEVRDGSRTLPRAILLGMAGVHRCLPACQCRVSPRARCFRSGAQLGPCLRGPVSDAWSGRRHPDRSRDRRLDIRIRERRDHDCPEDPSDDGCRWAHAPPRRCAPPAISYPASGSPGPRGSGRWYLHSRVRMASYWTILSLVTGYFSE